MFRFVSVWKQNGAIGVVYADVGDTPDVNASLFDRKLEVRQMVVTGSVGPREEKPSVLCEFFFESRQVRRVRACGHAVHSTHACDVPVLFRRAFGLPSAKDRLQVRSDLYEVTVFYAWH